MDEGENQWKKHSMVWLQVIYSQNTIWETISHLMSFWKKSLRTGFMNTSTMCKEHISTFNGPIQIMAFKEQKKPVVMM